MTTPQDNGGPAFPVPGGGCLASGISIRDYFAAAALQGMIASGDYLLERMHENPEKTIGDMAYLAADEMLAARKEGA